MKGRWVLWCDKWGCPASCKPIYLENTKREILKYGQNVCRVCHSKMHMEREKTPE